MYMCQYIQYIYMIVILQIYEMSSGEQIANFLFDVILSRVCMSNCQSSLYVGTVTGAIYKISLHKQVCYISGLLRFDFMYPY